jgi:5-carboxymethyl-2-hydroxymuconate isomerase
MPHMIVEYSADIEDELRTGILCPKLCGARVGTGVLAWSGIRVRGEVRSRYHIFDSHSGNAFVHTVPRAGHGRDEATLTAAAG